MSQFLVYLAGPITGLDYGEATGWREIVKDVLDEDISTLSPMRGKQYLKERSLNGAVAGTYEEFPLSSGKGINVRDYNDVKRSDAIFVNLLGAKTISIGTVMEIAWARAFDKPCILVMEDGNVHTHTMLEYPCLRVTSLEEGVNVLQALLLPDKKVKSEV